MYLKKTLSFSALFLTLLTALALNAMAVCPGTYFKTVKTQALSIPLFNYWYQDFDSDGKNDLVGLSTVSNVTGPNNIVFYKRSANGFDTPPVVTSLGSSFSANWIGTGDINADGKRDIAVQSGSVISVYFNNGSGGFTLSPITTTITGSGNGKMVDINGDGRADLVTTESMPNSSPAYYQLAQADGSFGSRVGIGPSVKYAEWGDHDGNGTQDMFAWYKTPVSAQQIHSVASNQGGTFEVSGGVGTATQVTTVGDISGNGLFQGVTGLYPEAGLIYFTIYFYSPATVPPVASLKVLSHPSPTSYATFGAPQIGRFNDDAVNDIAFLGPRSYIIQENDGTGHFNEKLYSAPVSGIADEFSGDNRIDLISPRYAILSDNGNSVQAISFLENVCAPPGQTKFIDFDRDGQTDMGSWRAADGRWLWRDVASVDHDFFWGTSGDIPVPQDYDGDSQTDYAVFRPSNGAWYIYRSSDQQIFIMQFGAADDRPVPSDFDGDGKADVAVYRPSTGTWYIWQSGSSSLFAANFGLNGDIPLPLDYDGDGRSDLAVFRPSNGTWYEFRSADSSYFVLNFGLAGDKPVPADYDSDGKADIAVFRDGTWYMIRSKNNGFFVVNFGVTGDIPFATNNTQTGRGTSLTVYRPNNTFIYDYQIAFYSYPGIGANRIISGILPID